MNIDAVHVAVPVAQDAKTERGNMPGIAPSPHKPWLAVTFIPPARRSAICTTSIWIMHTLRWRMPQWRITLMPMNTTPERLSITFGAARLAFLQAEAARLDIGIGELIRRIVDQYRLVLGMCDGTHNR